MSATPTLPQRWTSTRRAGLPAVVAAARSRIPPDDTLARAAAIGVLALVAGAVLWSRLIVVNNSLWGDEAFSVVRYINGGPSVIWDSTQWLQNDHMMFEFLSWATVGILGSHIEATYRIWSVLPALAGGAVMTWWLWMRIDRWAAVIFAVAAGVAPLYFDLGTQARGYGIGFFAGAMFLVSADQFYVTRRLRWLVAFAVSGFVGMATLEIILAPFLAAAAVLCTVRPIRRQVVIAVACAGAATLLWYSPVLTVLRPIQKFGVHLPWYGFVWTPIHDLIGAQVNGLEPSIPVAVASLIGALAAVAGGVSLWRRADKRLVLLFVAPVCATFFVFEGAAYYHIRFGAVEMLPTIGLAAVGVAALGRAAARTRPLQIAAVVLLVATSLITLGRFMNYATAIANVPYESAKNVGEIVRGSMAGDPSIPVFSNTRFAGAFTMAIRPARLRIPPPANLKRIFCSYRARFIYIEQQYFLPHPPTSCLVARNSFRISVPERRSKVWVWMVPAYSGPRLLPAPGGSVTPAAAQTTGPRTAPAAAAAPAAN
jgi:hypothetical protein